jgi:hypothetical protein
MSALTTLKEFHAELVSERDALENVDVDSKVKEKLAEIEVSVRAEIESELSHSKLVADIQIKNIEKAISRVEIAEAEAEAEAEKSSSLDEEPLEIPDINNGTY